MVLFATGAEAKGACGIDQLCAGLEAGIEGAVHAVQSEWDAHYQDEEIGFLMVDADNAFNRLNRTAMLWTVRHECPTLARYAFNTYRHWSLLVIRGTDGTATFLYSKEGLAQGDPIAMICYGVGTLPLVRPIKKKLPDTTQSNYADDLAILSKFKEIREYAEHLQAKGPHVGYFIQLSKCVLVVPERLLEAARVALGDLGFQITTGHRYLGGFIGEEAARQAWLQEQVEGSGGYVEAAKALAIVAKTYPQSAYCAWTKSLQRRWQYVQSVTANCGDNFKAVEEVIRTEFLPALFDATLDADDLVHQLAPLPVKLAGLAIQSPTQSAQSHYEASTLVNAHLIASIRGREKFRHAEHVRIQQCNRTEL